MMRHRVCLHVLAPIITLCVSTHAWTERWTEVIPGAGTGIDGTKGWNKITASSNGAKLAAVVLNGFI